jgi:hypothetical protein
VGSLRGRRRKVCWRAGFGSDGSVGYGRGQRVGGSAGATEALAAAVGPIKQRDRGFGAGELLVGIASAQLIGEEFLVGLDRQRADVAGQVLAPVPGLCSTTAAGLAGRFTTIQ